MCVLMCVCVCVCAHVFLCTFAPVLSAIKNIFLNVPVSSSIHPYACVCLCMYRQVVRLHKVRVGVRVRAHSLCAQYEWVRGISSSIRELKLKGMCGNECRGAFMSRPIVHSQCLPHLTPTLSPFCPSSLSTSVSISLSLSSFLSHIHLLPLDHSALLESKCLSVCSLSLTLSPSLSHPLSHSLSLFLHVLSWGREARLSCGLNCEHVECSPLCLCPVSLPV